MGFFIGIAYSGSRWNTVSWSTWLAMVWMTWMPVAAVPMTPTRLPVQSTSLGQRAVWKIRPLNSSCPANCTISGADSIPAQLMKYCAWKVSSLSVMSDQRLLASS